MKIFSFIVLGLSLSGQLWVSGDAKAALTEEQLKKRILCKDANPEMDEKHLRECISEKFEVSHYRACNGIDKKFGKGDFDACLQAPVSPQQKKDCVDLKNDFMELADAPDCFSSSVKTESIVNCQTGIGGYGVDSYNKNSIYLKRKDFENRHVTTAFSRKVYKQFINSCYKSDPQVVKDCFKHFNYLADNSLLMVGRCLTAEGTEEKINKCRDILNNTYDPQRILTCLAEIHAAKIITDSEVSVEAAVELDENLNPIGEEKPVVKKVDNSKRKKKTKRPRNLSGPGIDPAIKTLRQ